MLLPRMKQKTKRTLAYVFFVLVAVLGVWRVESTANDSQNAAEKAQDALLIAEAETRDRIKSQCESSNEARIAIKGAFDDLLSLATANPIQREGESSEEFAERVERTRQFIIEYNAQLDQRVKLDDCEALGKKPDTSGR